MTIKHEREDHVLRIELCRPERRNALSRSMLEQLAALFAQASQDQDIRAVFLHSQAGVFSAGGDIGEQLPEPSADPDTPAGRMIAALLACTKPVIACVDGPAVGLAVTTLCCCDIVIASTRSLFSLPFTALGLTPRFGASLFLVSAAGYQKAAEKLLLSEPITAQEALAMRLVTELADAQNAYDQAWQRALRVTRLPPGAVRKTKELLALCRRDLLLEAQRREASAFGEAAASPESREARAAFLEGRRPSFSQKPEDER